MTKQGACKGKAIYKNIFKLIFYLQKIFCFWIFPDIKIFLQFLLLQKHPAVLANDYWKLRKKGTMPENWGGIRVFRK